MSKERGVRLATSGNRADTAGCQRYAVLTLRLLRFSGDGSLVLLLAATVAVSALIEATEPKPRGFLSRLLSEERERCRHCHLLRPSSTNRARSTKKPRAPRTPRRQQ